MEDLPGLKSAIATVLRRVRREARLSQQKLSDFAGLSRIHIAQLEGRRQNATLNVLLLIAMALNLDGLSLLRMIHEEMLRTGHVRRKSVRRKPVDRGEGGKGGGSRIRKLSQKKRASSLPRLRNECLPRDHSEVPKAQTAGHSQSGIL